MNSDVREGFLCPICLQDLQSFHKLQYHFENSHTAEDKAVFDQIKGLFSKAKEALLGQNDGIEVNSNTSDFQSFSTQLNADISPPVWEPQELGTIRCHMESFKRIRDFRIDRFVIESNKVVIRLDKLLSHVRLTGRPNKDYEQTVVPWVRDDDVPFCPTCGSRFQITRRRHHCRLCGAIMCTGCSMFIPFNVASQLVKAVRKPMTHHRTRSLQSASLPIPADPDLAIRCCHDCYKVLMKRKRTLDQQVNQPLQLMLYQKLRSSTDAATRCLPEYQRMAESLNQGEETFDLSTAIEMRFKMAKFYETIDVISKKIAALDTDNQENPPPPIVIALQNSIRRASHFYLQENMLTLQSLPSLPKLEMLQKERRKKRERQLRLDMERAEMERIEAKRKHELEKLLGERTLSMKKSKEIEGQNSSALSGIVLNGGWSSDAPVSNGLYHKNEDNSDRGKRDPIAEQIEYVEQMIDQAQSSGRIEEVKSLKLHLQELKEEYRRKNISKAFALSEEIVESNGLHHERQLFTEKRMEIDNSDRSTLIVNENPFLEDATTSKAPNSFATIYKETLKNSIVEPSVDETFSPSNNASDTGDDPLFQQICYVSHCLDEAVRLGKNDETAILRENLRELQSLYNS